MRPTSFLRAMTALLSAASLAACSGDGSSISGNSSADGLETIPVIVDDDPLYEYHTDGDPVTRPGTGTTDGSQGDPTTDFAEQGPADDEAPAPEPGTMVLLGGGLAALAASRRRRKNKA